MFSSYKVFSYLISASSLLGPMVYVLFYSIKMALGFWSSLASLASLGATGTIEECLLTDFERSSIR